LGLDIPPDALAGGLSVYQQHLVMLGKAMFTDKQIVILDNISRKYSEKEVQDFGHVLRRVAAGGMTFLCLFYHLDGLCRYLDRVTVLYQGITTKVLDPQLVHRTQLSRIMTGQADNPPQAHNAQDDEVLLRVQNLRVRGRGEAINFFIRKGETVALVDEDETCGNAVAGILSGMDTTAYESGELLLHNHPLRVNSRADAIKLGIAYLPEDASRRGLCLNMDLQENLLVGVSPVLPKQFGDIKKRVARFIYQEFQRQLLRNEGRTASDQMEELDDITRFAALFYKWRLINPSLFIMMNPSAYNDEVTREYIFRQISALNADGIAVLITTKNVYDVQNLCNYVVHIQSCM